MAKNPNHSGRYLPPKDHLAAIGAVAAIWTAIEFIMESTILGLYEIDLGRGLVLTNNLSFHSRMSLLRILQGDAEKGPIGNAALAVELKDILIRIDAGYGDRNAIVHGFWGPTDKPGIIRRLSVRARGKKLQTIAKDYTAADIGKVRDDLSLLCADFVALSYRMGIDDRLATAPVHSKAPRPKTTSR